MSSYLFEKYLAREKLLLETGDNGLTLYCLNRTWLATLAQPFINFLCNEGVVPNILEIGCGNGKSILSILEENHQLEPSRLIATSLTELPGHNLLKQRGISVVEGVVAEELPYEWTSTFDIIIACESIGWSDLTESIPEVDRILKNGGFFLGYEDSRILGLIHEQICKIGTYLLLDVEPKIMERDFAFAYQKTY